MEFDVQVVGLAQHGQGLCVQGGAPGPAARDIAAYVG
jgi:hypothetical protein